jgi:hypothetical protein
MRQLLSTMLRRHTDAYDEPADGEAGEGILDQVRRASSQQSRRGAHAVIIVGRSEGFAVFVSDAIRASTLNLRDSLSHGGLSRLSQSCGGERCASPRWCFPLVDD